MKKTVRESSRLMLQLQQDISELERWLASQQMGTTFKGIKGSSVSLVPTVESLVTTRRMLLASLESAHKELQSSNVPAGKS